MSFLSEVFDFIFAPAGTFDSDSGAVDTSSDNDFSEQESMMVNPANGMPMIAGTGGVAGVDVLGNSYGVSESHLNEDDHSTMFSHDDCGSAVDHSMPMFDDSAMHNSASPFDDSSMFDCSSSSTGSAFDD